MPIILEDIKEQVTEKVTPLIEKAEEYVAETIPSTNEMNNDYLIVIAVVVLFVLWLLKPFLGAIFFLLRIFLIIAIIYLSLIIIPFL